MYCLRHIEYFDEGLFCDVYFFIFSLYMPTFLENLVHMPIYRRIYTYIYIYTTFDLSIPHIPKMLAQDIIEYPFGKATLHRRMFIGKIHDWRVIMAYILPLIFFLWGGINLSSSDKRKLRIASVCKQWKNEITLGNVDVPLPNYMRRLANISNSHLASIAKMESFFCIKHTDIYMQNDKWVTKCHYSGISISQEVFPSCTQFWFSCTIQMIVSVEWDLYHNV